MPFIFKPLPPLKKPTHFPFPNFFHPLGPLRDLGGTWEGSGFNTIWRPHFGGTARFLELNLTSETLQFDPIQGEIPNRGLLQPDINMFGLTYMQRITDANMNAGLHIEPGIWAAVPPTTNPSEPSTVVRMASIPHGTTILAQGIAQEITGPPAIPNNNINPFLMGTPSGATGQRFGEQDLLFPTQDRTSGKQLNGISQPMIDNPNGVLRDAIAGQTISHTIVLDVTTTSIPVQGGGTANTAFLKPNADATEVHATFWIERVERGGRNSDFLQLQYSQTVILTFDGLAWPHVTVATLLKKVPRYIPPKLVDPLIPAKILQRIPSPGPERARKKSTGRRAKAISRRKVKRRK